MAQFQASDILSSWKELLDKELKSKNCKIIREHRYIHDPLPFRAIHMGKFNDEYFLDEENNKIHRDELQNDMDLLILKDFHTESDLSRDNKQALKATSYADLYVSNQEAEVIIELEVFKDKPFSNLIYIPEACKSERNIPLYFLHCFTPKRVDPEAELTRSIGLWLMAHPQIHNFIYKPLMMPELSPNISYLLPDKKFRPKPKEYEKEGDKEDLFKYSTDFMKNFLLPELKKYCGIK